MLFFAASVLLGNTDNKLSANDFVDDNVSALTDDLGMGNPLCRGQLFKNCHSSEGICSFNISPTVSCSLDGYKSGVNPN